MPTFVAKGINVSCRTIEGEAFIFNHETKVLLQLNEVGSFVWDQIVGNQTIDGVLEKCIKEFTGDVQEVRNSVKEFIYELFRKNVVTLSSEPLPEEMTSVC